MDDLLILFLASLAVYFQSDGGLESVMCAQLFHVAGEYIRGKGTILKVPGVTLDPTTL